MDYPCTWWEIVQGKFTPFVDGVSRQIFRCLDSGYLIASNRLPVGALYSLDRSHCKGPHDWPPVGYDGLSIACKCADHTWYIDSRASNCTMPEDRVHRCWVRHGTVGEKLTVDKSGPTCGAGAGSFFMDDNRWHGFLRNGVMVQG